MPTPKALHSKKTPRWGTPQDIIELARTLMGGIHLDPASSEEFNAYVKALMIYREQDNGLAPECEWAGNVFLNPPGGLVTEFWNKLCLNYMSGNVTQAFWVGFSVEQLCTLADEKYHPMDFSTCILRKRLCFNEQKTTPTGKYEKVVFINTSTQTGLTYQEEQQVFVPDGGFVEEIKQGNSPSHGNYITSLGCDRDLFVKLFKDKGKIYHGTLANTKVLTPT